MSRAVYSAEKRTALAAWAQHVESIQSGLESLFGRGIGATN